MTVTQFALWVMLILFASTTFLQAAVAVVVGRMTLERAWFWRCVAIVSAVLTLLYAIEVFRLRSPEANLPWILVFAAIWVALMGVAVPIDVLLRLRRYGYEQLLLGTAVRGASRSGGQR